MILVTGGAGFVGSRIVHALRAENRPVRVLVRSEDAGEQLRAWGCETVVGDLTEPASLRRALEGVDVVVHLVAILAGKPEEFERVMTQGTRDLVALAREAGVRRFVLMSALGVDEQTKDLVPYYRAKWDTEQIVKESGLEHVIFRPSFVFGPGGGALQRFRRIAKLAPVTPIAGPGTQRIQPIWVDDVAAYFGEGLVRPEAANRTFEIGGPDVVTWNDFWERLKRARGSRRPSLHVPMGVMRVQASLFSVLPKPPVTQDQLKMLQGGDNVVSTPDAVDTFGLPLVPLDEQLRRATAKDD
jgi:NADH dehydrogenase